MSETNLAFILKNKTKVYYFLHLTGWYVVAFGNEYLGLVALGSASLEDTLSGLISLILACTLTHLYRLFLLKIHYFEQQKSPYYLFFSCLISALIIAGLVTFVDTWLEWWIFGANYFNWVDFMSLLLNVSRYIAMWLLLYFFYKFGILQLRQNEQKLQVEKALTHAQSEIAKLRLSAGNWEKIFEVLLQKIEHNPHLARQLLTDFSEVLRDFLNYKKESLSPLAQEINMLSTWLKVAQFYYPKTHQLLGLEALRKHNTYFLPSHSVILTLNFVLEQQDKQGIHTPIELFLAPNALFCVGFEGKSEDILEAFAMHSPLQNVKKWIQLSEKFEADLDIIYTKDTQRYIIQVPTTNSSTP